MNANIWPFVTWVVWIAVVAGLSRVVRPGWRDTFRQVAVMSSVGLVLTLAIVGFLLVVTL